LINKLFHYSRTNFINENGKKETKSYVVTKDEGPRAGTSLEALAGLRPVFCC
jgi:acetyl-CoA acyltransferase